MKIKIVALITLLTVLISLIISFSSASSDIFSIKDDIFSEIFQFTPFMETLSNLNKMKLTNSKFVNKTIYYEYGKFRPRIRKDKELKDYFKNLDLQENYVYTVLQFESDDTVVDEMQNKVLEKEGAKQIGKYGKEVYVYKFPKEILETQTYDFIKWIDVPKKQDKIDRELKNSLELDKSLIVKVEFYESYTDNVLSKVNKFSKFINKDDWEPGENQIIVLVAPKTDKELMHNIDKIASLNFVKSVRLISTGDKRKMRLFVDQSEFYYNNSLFNQPRAVSPWKRDERKVNPFFIKDRLTISEIVCKKEVKNEIS